MPRGYLIWLTVFVTCVSLCSACKVKREEAVPPGGEAAAPAEPPEGFSLICASDFKVANYKGQVLILDFWATWCGPCKREIPHLIKLQEKYRDQGLTIVGITFDDNPDKDVPPYAAKVGMNYVNVRGTDEMKGDYAIMGLPTIIIYDRDGNLDTKRDGYIGEEKLEEIIKRLLSPPA
ncbi:MAG: redoxin domain-containing protein [candidate division Zixibacteria bacterium]|nr:redoxin domain-containing protein [candidate division Zixibacteria bacterium]